MDSASGTASNWNRPGETNCLLKTKLSDGASGVMTESEFCSVLCQVKVKEFKEAMGQQQE